MRAAESRGFPVNPVMTQAEAHRRLRAMLDALPEDERRRWDMPDSADDGEATRH
jgi:hypothetical protein